MLFKNLMLDISLNFPLYHLGLGAAVLIAGILCFSETIAETIYLHRYLTHNSLKLNKVVCYVFEFILFFTTGIPPMRWVKIHIKHHQNSDKSGDIHSPVVPMKIFGLKITGPLVPFLKYFYLYHPYVERYLFIRDSINKALKYESKFSRIVFHKLSFLGPIIFVILLTTFFGWTGFIMWLAVFLYLPIVAGAGVNGLGHGSKEVHTETGDHAHDILSFIEKLPTWAQVVFSPVWLCLKTALNFMTGGEYRHYIHHLKLNSARLTLKKHEFDIGWGVIWLLWKCRLADNIRYISNKNNEVLLWLKRDKKLKLA